jgi:hypothetical protein
MRKEMIVKVRPTNKSSNIGVPGLATRTVTGKPNMEIGTNNINPR